jgi:hypothetical protein
MAKGNAGRLAGNAVKLGVKYGPVLYGVARHGKEPARAAAEKFLSKKGSRKKALAHAATLLDGSVLQVFHGGEPVYIVFSGEEMVASQPPLDVPLQTLVQRADLTKRIRPDDVNRKSRGRRPDDANRWPKIRRRP